METPTLSGSADARLSRLKDLVARAAIAVQKGEVHAALTTLQDAVRTATTDSERDQLFWQLNQLAGMLVSHQQFAAARQILLLVLSHVGNTPENPSAAGIMTLNLARTSRALGLLEEAESHLDRAEALGNDAEHRLAVLGERLSIEAQLKPTSDLWSVVWAARADLSSQSLFGLLLARYLGLHAAQKVCSAAELLRQVTACDWDAEYRSQLGDMSAAVADAMTKDGDHLEACKLWREALSMLPPDSCTGFRRSYLSRAALAHRTIGDHQSALQLYDKALSAFDSQETEDRAECFGDKGISLMCLGRYQEAELDFREAVKIARHSGNNGILAVSLDNLGLVLWARRSSLTQSLNFLEEATTRFNLLGESVQAGNCWLHLFQVCIEVKSDRALEVGAKAYDLLRRVGPAHLEALCLHMLVEVSIDRGSPLMNGYLRELAGDRLHAKTSVEVSALQAYAAVETGNYLQCLRLLASKEIQIDGTSDWRSVVKSLQYAGAALVALGAHNNARTLYARIQTLGLYEPNLKRYGGFRAVVQLLGAIGLGVVALVSGAPEAAKSHFLRAIEIVEGQHGNMLRCRLSPTVATEYANCVTQASSGLDEFCLNNLAQNPALIKLLCMQPGFYIFDLSVPAKFSTTSTLQFQSSTTKEEEDEAESFAVFDNRELSDIYRLLIEKVMLPTNAVTEALTILENSRSRFYMEDVRNRDALSNMRHVAMSGGTFRPESYTQVTQWLHSHEQTALIEFFIGKDAGFAWIGLPFGPVEMRVLELPHATENALAALAKACGVVSLDATLPIAQTAKQSTQAVAELVRELYDLLFADVRIGGDHFLDFLERAGIKRLVLVPYGGLHFLPLHAARDASGRYLCDRFEICYSPSAWFINRNLTLPRTLAERILVVSNPDGSLSSTEAEMDSLYPLFSEGVLLGPGEATLAAVMSGLAGAQGVHFSCHGTFVPGKMDRTGLWLSNDEFLSVKTLMPDGKNFHRKPYAPNLRLAFLAACETGLDDWKPYEEPLSLATCFMATGATSVISTLWSVPNDAAARLVPAFYRNLRVSGMPMGSALHTAIDAVRQEWPDPWYWAAYTLSGSWL